MKINCLRRPPNYAKSHSVAILVRMTLLEKIELFLSSDLSSRDLNCQNNIQLFLQQFEKSGVNGDTNKHYKVLGTKQTSE